MLGGRHARAALGHATPGDSSRSLIQQRWVFDRLLATSASSWPRLLGDLGYADGPKLSEQFARLHPIELWVAGLDTQEE